MLSNGDWQIEPDADDATVYAVLAQDRIWNGYAIADLEPPFRQYAHFSVARQGARPPSAACLVFRHPAFTSTIVHGEEAGVAAILAAIDLPQGTQLLARSEHVPLLERWYDFPSRRSQMLRMAVSADTFHMPAASLSTVERLAADDLPALFSLYEEYVGNVFNADHLHSGIFYGARAGGRLIAAGGTHVMTPRYGIAAVGDIFTRAAARGHGYATAITAAVTADLLGAGCRDIFLNVAAVNAPAIAVYTRLGYQEHCRFWEAHVMRT